LKEILFSRSRVPLEKRTCLERVINHSRDEKTITNAAPREELTQENRDTNFHLSTFFSSKKICLLLSASRFRFQNI